MSIEGYVEPWDERCYPGEDGWEGGRAVGKAKTAVFFISQNLVVL